MTLVLHAGLVVVAAQVAVFVLAAAFGVTCSIVDRRARCRPERLVADVRDLPVVTLRGELARR